MSGLMDEWLQVPVDRVPPRVGRLVLLMGLTALMVLSAFAR